MFGVRGRTPEFTLLALGAGLLAAVFATLAALGKVPAPSGWGVPAAFALFMLGAGTAVLGFSPREDWQEGVVLGAVLRVAAPAALVLSVLALAVGSARALSAVGFAEVPNALRSPALFEAASAAAFFVAFLAGLAATSSRGRGSAARRGTAVRLVAWSVGLSLAGLLLGKYSGWLDAWSRGLF